MPFSTEDWLRGDGVDTQKSENAAVLASTKDVAAFEHSFLNKQPSPQECAEVEPRLRHLMDLLVKLPSDPRVAEQARGTLCAAAETVLKNSDLPQDAPVVQLCRYIVLRGVDDPSPEFDPKYHLPFDMPSWGSPSPRIEAAQGVTHLLWNYGPNADVVHALEVLAKDRVPAVRYQVAIGLPGFYKHKDQERFWTFLKDMLANETTSGVMLGLLAALGRVAGAEPEQVVALLAKTIARGLPTTKRSEMTRTLVQILTGLYVARSNESASKQLVVFESSPIQFKNEVGDEVFTASHYLVPENADLDVRRRAGGLLHRVVIATYTTLDNLTEEPDTKEKGEKIGVLLQHIDEVASRIFFTLDVDEKVRNDRQGLSDENREQIYYELKPVITLLARGPSKSPHRLLPHTAHYLLETLNGVLKYDPADVIKLGADICRAGSQFNYQFDQMAISEIVKLVEKMLADHMPLLRERDVADSVGSILDIFVRAGWPEAMQLTFRLDQVIR